MPQSLVIPLDISKSPYMAELSRTDWTVNCLVYDLEFLQLNQALFAENELQNWGEILRGHLNTEQKLELRDMALTGKGVFAQEKIEAGELLIYPGQLIDIAVLDPIHPIPQEERIYFLSMLPDEEVYFDPKYTECLGKYLQHLPGENSDDFVDLGGVIPALENLNSFCIYVTVRCENAKYIVPLRVFTASLDIEPGSIVGFDYGKHYWECLKRKFTYFTIQGVPITCYYLYNNENQYQLSESSFHTLVRNGFVVSHDSFLFIPSGIRDELETLSVPTNIGTYPIEVNMLREFKFNYYYIFNNKDIDKREAVLIKRKFHRIPMAEKISEDRISWVTLETLYSTLLSTPGLSFSKSSHAAEKSPTYLSRRNNFFHSRRRARPHKKGPAELPEQYIPQYGFNIT